MIFLYYDAEGALVGEVEVSDGFDSMFAARIRPLLHDHRSSIVQHTDGDRLESLKGVSESLFLVENHSESMILCHFAPLFNHG